MLVIPPAPYRKRRGKDRRIAAPSPPVGPLTLVACAYEPATFVELTFDRPIDIAGLDGSVIVIDDGSMSGFRYAATLAATLTAPAVVRIELDGIEEFAGPDVRLTAGAANGIVAVGDGAAWAGVTNVGIPFP
jgi:hypothetical protein